MSLAKARKAYKHEQWKAESRQNSERDLLAAAGGGDEIMDEFPVNRKDDCSSDDSSPPTKLTDPHVADEMWGPVGPKVESVHVKRSRSSSLGDQHGGSGDSYSDSRPSSCPPRNGSVSSSVNDSYSFLPAEAPFIVSACELSMPSNKPLPSVPTTTRTLQAAQRSSVNVNHQQKTRSQGGSRASSRRCSLNTMPYSPIINVASTRGSRHASRRPSAVLLPATSPAGTGAPLYYTPDNSFGASSAVAELAEESYGPNLLVRLKWRVAILMVINSNRAVRAFRAQPCDQPPAEPLHNGRLLDYFAVFGVKNHLIQAVLQELQLGISLSSAQQVFLPPSQEHLNIDLVDRYPAHDHPDRPFDNNWQAYAFPQGIQLRSTPTKPTFLYAVLTLADGTSLFVTYLLYYLPIYLQTGKSAASTSPSVPLAPFSSGVASLELFRRTSRTQIQKSPDRSGSFK
eukprot:gb/GEZN01002293.1/.p1 GENE.gb/GEZN01002293.1/~~gb/GEZN01002293.1/.p1  ORF type:complete len:484 (-),score=76.87 gb/GEZN01002293.1/:1096-2460(-)